MNNKTGRPMGDQIIEGKIHSLIKEMIIDFKSKKGKFLCVLVGGPGNGKTDLMEFTSEIFFNTFNIDQNIFKMLKTIFRKKNFTNTYCILIGISN
jgi:hypothetical protein